MNINKILILLILSGFIVTLVQADPKPLTQHPEGRITDQWQFGVQCWSFNRFTLFEAIDKAQALGLQWLEAYPGQTVSKKHGKIKFKPGLSLEIQQEVKDKLADAGITMINYGVINLPNNEVESRKVFEFAKQMEIRTIVTEPPLDAYDVIDKLCKEYKIPVAIHNHAKPTRYWDPNLVRSILDKHSNWIGICPDTGHWVKSKLVPADELKKFNGRIYDMHLKDVNEKKQVVVYGQGKANIADILKELYDQKYAGPLVIEHEANWENNMPDIQACIEFYNEQVKILEKDCDWQDLLADDLSNMDLKPGSWSYKHGVLIRNGKGDIWTKKEYENFILDFEFKVAKDTNSGVFLRAGDHNWLPWPEVQVLDSFDKPATVHSCGGIYDIKAPRLNAVRPSGMWNRMTIQTAGSSISVVLNNHQVLNIDLNDWTEPHKNPDGSKNKFNIAYKDLPKKGYIGFQDHHTPVWYRNIRIKEIK